MKLHTLAVKNKAKVQLVLVFDVGNKGCTVV